MSLVADINISQGSVSMCLRYGGIFIYDYIANLLLSLIVKVFWKSVNFWRSGVQEFSVLFFIDPRCSNYFCSLLEEPEGALFKL